MERMVRQGRRCNLGQETLTLRINIAELKQTSILTPSIADGFLSFLKKKVKLLFGIISGLTEQFQRN